MSNTNSDQTLPLIWTSGDWVQPAQPEPPYNGLQIRFSPVYDAETNKLTTLNVEIQDYTHTPTGTRQSTTFPRVADGIRVQFQPSAPVSAPTSPETPTPGVPTPSPDASDATVEQSGDPSIASQPDAESPDDAESDSSSPPSLEASAPQTPEPVAEGGAAPVVSEPETPTSASSGDTGSDSAGFTVQGNLELRFTQDSPGQVVVMASLAYGLPSYRHHVQGGLKEIPLTSASPALPRPHNE